MPVKTGKGKPGEARRRRAAIRCPRYYLGGFAWWLGAFLLAAVIELPSFAAGLLMLPGCAASAYGWCLLQELYDLPEGQRPGYVRFLNNWRVRNVPFLMSFFALILLLM